MTKVSCNNCGVPKVGCECDYWPLLDEPIGSRVHCLPRLTVEEKVARICKLYKPTKPKTPGEAWSVTDMVDTVCNIPHCDCIDPDKGCATCKQANALSYDAGWRDQYEVSSELQAKVDELEAIIARKANEGMEAMGFDRAGSVGPGDGSCKAYNGLEPDPSPADEALRGDTRAIEQLKLNEREFGVPTSAKGI